MVNQGIVFNEAEQVYDTPWGWIKFEDNPDDPSPTAMNVKVYGPSAPKWFDLESALNSASMFIQVSDCSDIKLQIAIAIHGQYAAWQGLKFMENAIGIPLT